MCYTMCSESCLIFNYKDMKVIDTYIEGLKIFELDVFGDERGFFVEKYNESRFSEYLEGVSFVQDNLSKSAKGVLRGLHFQTKPFKQGKLVSVVSGRVFDVAVDIREGSQTYGEHFSIELSEPVFNDGKWTWQQFYIPEGFAHGFLSLEDDTLFSYKCTNYYAPEHDAGVMWNDEDIAIEWPKLDVDYNISQKDKNHPSLKQLKNKQ